MQKTTRPLPPLDFLRGFEAAARHLSFTRAATELFLTQSAVSRQIQSLEEFIGVPLFERRHKSLALTEAGQAYLRTVSPALDQLRDATRRLRESRTGHILTVTTTVSFASMWLVPRLARFRRLHPKVDVRINATHEVIDMEREGIDVAIRDCAANRAPPGSVVLVSEHLAPVCSPEYVRESRAARRPLAKAEDLRHHVLLYVHDPAGRWPWITWAAWLETRGIEELEPASTIGFGQYDQVIQGAIHGQGIALGRMSLATRLVKDKQLVVLFDRHHHHIARAFHAVYAPNAQARPEARHFVEWIREELAREG
jgi:LysR family glycine cleavage system transcriptional activator